MVSRDRGIRLQNALARYLTQWWPHAESAGSGRPGTDILGTPGIVWECKTAGSGNRNIGQWINQAKGHAPNPSVISVVVYYPPGVGEMLTSRSVAMLPLADAINLLNMAGYGTKEES